MKHINIAVDGTAGSGKSSVMKRVAVKLKMNFIDTGVMYRAFTKFCLDNQVNFLNDKEIEKQIKNFNFKYINENSILVNNVEYGKTIFDYDVAENIKYVAKNNKVRKFMVLAQREMTQNKNNIVIGRDITTVVLPNAELKIYFDCSVEARAQRRFNQNKRKKITPNVYEDILRQIQQRDDYDKNREMGALKIAPDAWYLNTSNLSIGKVIRLILNKIENLK
ncbi:(d)CMP kinase [Spiroplasma cantharicola]|uniref:Cytidylate kinase n=1 Tax=Spiroplasma cantharicola TaxID=362837 RepID=A0A0M4JRV9_9MOLU|nr:(d)CMP kinase [Spiroplasma cantharicola]ALD66172.1 cytidylate kinase [Spiroplasma cantharicola]